MISASEGAPVWIKRKYLIEDTDRYKNVRFYVRMPGRKKIRIHGNPESEEFETAYRAAIGEATHPAAKPSALERPVLLPHKEGTFGWLCERYFAESIVYRRLDETTRLKRRRILESCLQEPINPQTQQTYATVGLKGLTKPAIEVLRDRKAIEFPESANNRLKALRGLFIWAAKTTPPLVSCNPAVGVESIHTGSLGFHTWTLEEVEQYKQRHPPGTPARRALTFYMFTGVRKSDVVRLGRQHLRTETTIVDPDSGESISQNWLRFTAYKNRNRHPVELYLPVLPMLQEEIDVTPLGQLTFLTTQHKRPYSAAGFGNRMRAWCDQAGLPHCTSHGLRKAAATIAAENGASETELNMLFGWSPGSKMAALYTRKARQKRIAGQAMGKLVPDHQVNESVPLSQPVEKSGTKSSKKISKISAA